MPRKHVPEPAAGPAGPGRHHTAPKAPPVWRAPAGPGQARARPIGGRRVACEAWPGFETTRRATPQRPGAAGVEGAGGTGGHGRASRSTTPSEARVWRSRGRPGPTAPGTPAVPHSNNTGHGRRASGRARRRPEHQRCHTATTPGPTASGRAGRAAAGDLSGEQATTAGFTRPRGGRPRA